MDILELMKNRYSCKKYDSRQITDDQLKAILQAGRLAPTAKNLQEQRIYVVQSASGLAKIDQCCPCRYNAPTVLVVAYDKNQTFTYPGGKYNSGAEDATIVATQMMLAAKAVGVESCWINYFNPDEMHQLLNLPDNEEIVMTLDLGFAAEGTGPMANHDKRKPLDETVKYI